MKKTPANPRKKPAIRKEVRKAPVARHTGRPAMFQTPEEMQVKIDEYFETQVGRFPMRDEEGKMVYTKEGVPVFEDKPPTQTDMALFLGFCDRQSLYDNAKRSEAFSCAIKRACSRIDAYAERGLFAKGKPTGEIFYLKNRGWTAEEKRDISGSMTQKVDFAALKAMKKLLDQEG